MTTSITDVKELPVMAIVALAEEYRKFNLNAGITKNPAPRIGHRGVHYIARRLGATLETDAVFEVTEIGGAGRKWQVLGSNLLERVNS